MDNLANFCGEAFSADGRYFVFEDDCVVWAEIPEDCVLYRFPAEPAEKITRFLKTLTPQDTVSLHEARRQYDFTSLTDTGMDTNRLFEELRQGLLGDQLHAVRLLCEYCRDNVMSVGAAERAMIGLERGFPPGQWLLVRHYSEESLADYLHKNGVYVRLNALTDLDEKNYWDALTKTSASYMLTDADSAEPDFSRWTPLNAPKESAPKKGGFLSSLRGRLFGKKP